MSKVNLATFRINLVSQPVCSSKLMPLYDSRLFTELHFWSSSCIWEKKLNINWIQEKRSTLTNHVLPLCFPSLNWAFLDDLNVSKNSRPFCSSTFFLALSHLCSEAKISTIRGKALPAASVSRKASRHLLATKSTADSQYSWRAQYATSASKNGYPWASRFPKPSF